MIVEHSMEHGFVPVLDEPLIRRIRGEYLEMPGLQLTLAQAQRLFGLSAHDCATLLNVLIAHKFLARRSNGAYVRAADGNPSAERAANRPSVQVAMTT